MKKITLFIATALIAGVSMGAIDYTARGQIEDIQKGEVTDNAIQTLYVSGAATIGGSITAGSLVADGVEVVGVQIDTNATTTITAYAPDAVGQLLIGSAGAGTTKVWCATSAGTNGWTLLN